MSPQSAPCSIACCITATCSSAVRGVGAPKPLQPQQAQVKLNRQESTALNPRAFWEQVEPPAQKTLRKSTALWSPDRNSGSRTQSDHFADRADRYSFVQRPACRRSIAVPRRRRIAMLFQVLQAFLE